MFERFATKTVRKAAAIGGLLFAVFCWTPAQAAFVLELTSGATTVTVTDGGAGDINPTAGRISFFGSIGTFSINLTSGISKPVIGTTDVGELDLSSFQISGSAAGTLSVRLTDTDFAQEGVAFGLSAIGGTTDGTVAASTYLGRTNAEFGTGELLTDFGVLTGPSFSDSELVSIAPVVNAGGSSPYSLTILATITHTAAGQTTGFDTFIQTSITEADVPAPASMAVFAFGLMALRSLRRRYARG
jgi:hypothetical protein